MKYIVGVFFSMLIFGFVACGNEGGDSPVVIRKKISYLDFNMYKGSVLEGALALKFDTVPSWNKDSLYRNLTLVKYLSEYSIVIENENRVSFEFLDNDVLSFTDLTIGKKIISSYIYVGDSLFVLKNGTEKLFVAMREKDGSGFYRTKSVMKKMLWSGDPEKPIKDTLSVKGEQMDSIKTFNWADFESGKNMISPRDTVIWSNIKYIYQ